jgi:hypothetical protein
MQQGAEHKVCCRVDGTDGYSDVDIALKEIKRHRFAGRLLSHAVERVEQIQLHSACYKTKRPGESPERLVLNKNETRTDS